MKYKKLIDLQIFAGHELQERYSNMVLAKVRKTAIFLSLFNRRYEGTPTSGAVKIPVRDTEVAVANYDKVKGGDLTTSATSYKTLPIDRDKYVNELIDGYEASAVPDNLVADRLDSAGYSMGISLDSELISLLADGGTVSENTSKLTKTSIYDSIVDEVAALKKKGLKPTELWLAVTNETYALLLKSPEFIKASALGDTVVQNGLVGRIAGLDVYETNNIPDESGVEYIIGNRIFCHFVDEWKTPVTVNDLKDGKHIGSSAVQGRRVYGHMLSRPETVTIKKNTAAQTQTSGSEEVPGKE